MKNLNTSLVAYLKAARDGSLDEVAISRLLSDLEAAEAYATDGQVAVASELVDLVIDYTIKLAEANSVDLRGMETESAVPGGGGVIELRRHLEMQRSIFIDAA